MLTVLARSRTLLRSIGIDQYMMLLILTALFASAAPAQGEVAEWLKTINFWAVSLLFFIYGAKLSSATIVSGLTNWKLQITILLCTFALFPFLWLVLNPIAARWLPTAMGVGFLYIGCLPSTIQSSIAFTSVSGGNIAGAICAASISNLIAVIVTPLLLSLLLPQSSNHAINPTVIFSIFKQILLPFAIGQLCRPWLSVFLNRQKLPMTILNRGSILLIVYAAFSAGAVNKIWSRISTMELLITLALCLVMFLVVMTIALSAGRSIGLGRSDLYAVLFCGSTKSLATGLPMAGILFPSPNLPLIVLPLMIYHLMQLIICTLISQQTKQKKNHLHQELN
ncbi:MAG: bile acid:sodium symporter [Rhodobacteraceae bacterium]|nr:bile acid:sodium symporter [Paracoccaceae bacterium]